jgi:hypothetical protein
MEYEWWRVTHVGRLIPVGHEDSSNAGYFVAGRRNYFGRKVCYQLKLNGTCPIVAISSHSNPVFHESHSMLKKVENQTFKSLEKIVTRRRVCLTGCVV